MTFSCSYITNAVITRPEGSDHPVVLGLAGDCPQCQEGLAHHAALSRYPTEIVPTSTLPPQIRDLAEQMDFCDCRACKFINSTYRTDANSHVSH